jgi:hypothetical protein
LENKSILKELKQEKYYSIIVDSTPDDVSRVDKLTLIFRQVLVKRDPVERFVSCIPFSGHSRAAMKYLVMVTLEKLHISNED